LYCRGAVGAGEVVTDRDDLAVVGLVHAVTCCSRTGQTRTSNEAGTTLAPRCWRKCSLPPSSTVNPTTPELAGFEL
jgi:hypothetical protein